MPLKIRISSNQCVGSLHFNYFRTFHLDFDYLGIDFFITGRIENVTVYGNNLHTGKSNVKV